MSAAVRASASGGSVVQRRVRHHLADVVLFERVPLGPRDGRLAFDDVAPGVVPEVREKRARRIEGVVVVCGRADGSSHVSAASR